MVVSELALFTPPTQYSETALRNILARADGQKISLVY